VTRAGGDDTPRAFLGVEPVEPGVGTADLERACSLQILAFEVDIPAVGTVQITSVFHRGPADDVREQFPRGGDLFAVDKPHDTRSFLFEELTPPPPGQPTARTVSSPDR